MHQTNHGRQYVAEVGWHKRVCGKKDTWHEYRHYRKRRSFGLRCCKWVVKRLEENGGDVI